MSAGDLVKVQTEKKPAEEGEKIAQVTQRKKDESQPGQDQYDQHSR